MKTVAVLHMRADDVLTEYHVYRDRTQALHFEEIQPYRKDANAYHWGYRFTVPAPGRSALVPYGARSLNLDGPQWIADSVDILRAMPAYTPRRDKYTGHYDRPPVVVIHGKLSTT